MQKWKSNDSYFSKAQGSQLVPSLPPTPWALASRRDNKIRDVLERYAYYHPEIRQNLPILPKSIRDTAKSMDIYHQSWS
jgi:hypothetical protein